MLAGFAQAGVRVGTDIRLVGFDDIEECALTWPQVSSVAVTRALRPGVGQGHARLDRGWERLPRPGSRR